MKVGNAVVASQEQSPPDHWANATQNHLELINARHLEARHWGLLYRTDYTAKRFPQFGERTNTQFFMLSRSRGLGSNGTVMERVP
jgi:hypothetical protein